MEIDENSSIYRNPDTAIFFFEGFNGEEDREVLVDTIKKNACRYGTVLSTTKAHTTDKHITITLACEHFGTQRVVKSNQM